MSKSLGDFIKQYRLKNNLKREEVALALGVSSNYIYSLEKGYKTSVSKEVLIKMADYLKISLDELVGRKTPKKK